MWVKTNHFIFAVTLSHVHVLPHAWILSIHVPTACCIAVVYLSYVLQVNIFLLIV